MVFKEQIECLKMKFNLKFQIIIKKSGDIWIFLNILIYS